MPNATVTSIKSRKQSKGQALHVSQMTLPWLFAVGYTHLTNTKLLVITIKNPSYKISTSAETIYPTVVFKSHVGSVYTVCFSYFFTRNCTVMSVCSGLHFPVLHVNLHTHNTNSTVVYYFVVLFNLLIASQMAIGWLQNESYIFVMISQSCYICDVSD